MNKEILRNDIMVAYNNTMTMLYKRYGGELKPELLRLYYLKVIASHIVNKSAAHIKSQAKKIECIKTNNGSSKQK